MTGSTAPGSTTFRLRLPATSANLGSGFDAVAVALSFYPNVEANPADKFSIDATGRDAERCSSLDDNLILSVYQKTLLAQGKPVTPLALRMVNDIPLGMGCGSSAAGRLAAVAMAVHYGGLGWDAARILDEASALEGHPDNVAACWLGGFVAAACEGRSVEIARVVPPVEWRAIIALPSDPLSTSKARAVLPDRYSRADTVANIQAASLLGLAFSQGRGDLLKAAMKDRIHQPYRLPICSLLASLLPLAGKKGILGVSLSGAGPAVLIIVENEVSVEAATELIRASVDDLSKVELRVCRFEPSGGQFLIPSLGSH
jgi:homoserine kinase